MKKAFTAKPFGKPDANDKNDRDLSELVDVGDLMPSFSYDEDPGSIRVIVGRKGTGKTHALRLLQVSARSAGSEVFSRNIDYDLGEERVVQSLFAQSASDRDFAGWERIWRCSLAVAALSRFTARHPDESAGAALSEAQLTSADVRADWPDYAIDSPEPLDPLGALLFIIARYSNAESLSKFVTAPGLEQVETYVSRLMRHCTPSHYFMDGFDEFEEENPELWLQIQLGLFWLAFRADTTRQRLRRVYLTVAVRDGVLGAAQRSIHSDRFDYGGNIMVLSWSKEAAVLFFRSALWKARNKSFWRRSTRWLENKPELGWLGISDIQSRGDHVEPVISYIVRHSRCTPRDLISVGNALAAKLNQRDGESPPIGAIVNNSIRPAAREIAELAVKAAAQELIRDPGFLLRQRRSQQDTTVAGIVLYLEELIKSALTSVGEEVSPIDHFRAGLMRTLVESGPEGEPELLMRALTSALWRNGLIAFRTRRDEDGQWRFVWSDVHKPDMQVPSDPTNVGIHPAAFESVRLTRSKYGPVF